jgi:hypothetical protein
MEAWQKAHPESSLPPKTILDDLLENLVKHWPASRLHRYLTQLLVSCNFHFLIMAVDLVA